MQTDSALLNRIAEAAELLEPALVFRGGGIADVQGDLSPAEAALSQDYHPKRRAEFQAGRLYARQAMAALGEPDHELLIGPNRAPLWPAGVVGTISHADTVCGAIVAPASSVRNIGFDLDADTPLAERLVPRICTPGELAWLDGRPDRLALAKQVFGIKESLYKVYAPLTGSFLGFQEATIQLDEAGGTFEAKVINPERPPLVAHGRYGQANGHVFAICLA
jgi:4'-phosphopantetheinyl transferase EntD